MDPYKKAECANPMPPSLAAEAIPYAFRPPVNERLVSEITDHLLLHNGPDEQGRAHRTRSKLPLLEVTIAIEAIKADGALPWLRPYHMSRVPNGTWQDPELVKEVLKKKCNALISEMFGGDLTRFCREIKRDDLLSPLKDKVGERVIPVSMRGLSKSFESSPYKMVKHYLEVIGRGKEYEWFRPYHISEAPNGTWQDPELVKEVLKKKCDALVSERFGGDLTRFCCEIKGDDLLSPLQDAVGDKVIPVSMLGLGRSFKTSPYKMAKHYLEVIGWGKEYEWFRPYHMKVAPQGTWQDSDIVREVLEKKCRALVSEMFGGDLTRFCLEITQDDLLSPLQDAVGDRVIPVSMSVLGHSFDNSPYKMAKHYLEVIGRGKEYDWFRPYHMSVAPRGTWQNPEIVKEVLKKKCDALVSERFGGDLTRFCHEITQEALLSPLQDVVDGAVISVGMEGVAKPFKYSPYKMVKHYLEVIGLAKEYELLRPYHMSEAPNGTWQDPDILKEVLERKCRALVSQTFGGDLTKFCLEITQEHLLSPLQDAVGDRVIPVSMHGLSKSFSDSPYKMAKHYLEVIGRGKEYDWFRPYHISEAPNGTWQDPELVKEVLKKKCDALVSEMFGGDLTRFCCELRGDHLLSPLQDAVGDKVIPVSMHGLSKSFESSPYKMAKHYLEIIGRGKEYDWFRPYHMKVAPQGTWQDADIVREVLEKKCRALVSEMFGSDLTRFCLEITQDDLLSPLHDAVGDKVIPVSMLGLGRSFKSSPYKMAKHYLEIIGREREYDWFRPYHMKVAPQGTWQDPELVKEVLKKKCDALVSERFGGDLTRFCHEITQEDILSPLQDAVGDRVISVSMSALSKSFESSPYKMVERYFKICNRPFKLTKACFIGSPETRARRQRGEFSSNELSRIRREDGSFNTSVFGFTNFNSKDKSVIRELMLETGEHELEDRSVAYLGLETEQFTSLRGVYQRLNLSPRDSLVVERDQRRFNAMQSTVARLPNGEGAALRGVSLRRNDVERELEEAPPGSFSFNLVNLDYLGHMSELKEYALQLLLEGKLLAPKALVFVTLQDSPLARSRAEAADYSADQAESVDQHLKHIAELTGHEVFRLAALPYIGGADSSSGQEAMLWLAYRITRKDEESTEL